MQDFDDRQHFEEAMLGQVDLRETSAPELALQSIIPEALIKLSYP